MIGETVPTPVSRFDAPRSDVSPAESPGQAEQDRIAKEIGGREGPEPTRYGDWEKNGRCIDF
jgi:hypothetical protein